MLSRLVKNEIKNQKLLSVSTVVFMAVSSLLIVLSITLFTKLLGSVKSLMDKAEAPSYLQMHAGEMSYGELEEFAKAQPSVKSFQVNCFLNLENSALRLGEKSMSDNTQDNGLSVQSECFDYLLDMDNNRPFVNSGEVYVPVCYRSIYNLQEGDKVSVYDKELTIKGFLRDSQMNSMMASSKRFLVCEEDYSLLKEYGSEEYLIEFLLDEASDTDAFAAAYQNSGLPANGPAITKALIKLMNALSDGIMIFVIFLVGIAVLLISLLCIGFITSLGVSRDCKEAGMLKVLGISKKEIRKLYFSKYVLFSAVGGLVGLIGAWLLIKPLGQKLRELYGASDNDGIVIVISVIACVFVQMMILLFIRRILKKGEKISVVQALFFAQEQKGSSEKNRFVIIGVVAFLCVLLAVIPRNLHTTLSSEKFVTYMGIGDADLRIDVRQSEHIEEVSKALESALENDSEVKKFTALKTVSCPAYITKADSFNLLIEEGDHSVFPVSYSSGKQPEKEDEIALSYLQAKDLDLSVGDKLTLCKNDQVSVVSVCGIYSDITNGGKTAKMAKLPMFSEEERVMWSILYVTLSDSSDAESWVAKYQAFDADIVNISDYVAGTYGPTISQIANAKNIALVIALIIITVVVVLFECLLIERNRSSISLQKAFGFRNSSVLKKYFIKGYVPVVIGLLAGTLLSGVLGELVCGMALQSLGASGFHFVIAPLQVVLAIALLIAASFAAVALGTKDILNIKAYECCRGRE